MLSTFTKTNRDSFSYSLIFNPPAKLFYIYESQTIEESFVKLCFTVIISIIRSMLKPQDWYGFNKGRFLLKGYYVIEYSSLEYIRLT